MVKVLILSLLLRTVLAEGFVKEVSCGSDDLTVQFNQDDPSLTEWMQSPQSQPVAYVYGYKARTPCGIALKTATGQPIYNFTIPYGQSCNVKLTDLEPNYRTAETTVAIEDNNDPTPSKNMRINHVFCLYTRRVEAIRFSDVNRGHEVVASVGGKPKPNVALTFLSKDGKPLSAAKFGDVVKLQLHLERDNAYKAILPKHCMFTDRENMDSEAARRLTFVQSRCPVNEISEIIQPLREINSESYATEFKTFRFGNQTTVFAHCSVQVCLDANECEKSCFIPESSTLAPNPLLPTTTPFLVNRTIIEGTFRPRRHRREVETPVSVSSALTILDEEMAQEVAHMPSLQRSSDGGVVRCLPDNTALMASSSIMYLWILIAILVMALFIATLIAMRLAHKLKRKTKEVELQCTTPLSHTSTYISGSRRSLAQYPPSTVHMQPPYHSNMSTLTRGNGAGSLLTIANNNVNDNTWGDSVRSVSEMTGPRMAWPANSMSIPRAHAN